MNTAYAQLEAEHQISSHPVAFPLISCRRVSATPAKRDDWPPDRPEARSGQLLPAVVYVGLFGRRNLALGLIRLVFIPKRYDLYIHRQIILDLKPS
jgi:hypothetical protein